jgi:glycine dehydrogenase
VLKLVVYVWGDAGRVDNVFGDRHLVCTNPSVEVIDEKIAAAA